MTLQNHYSKFLVESFAIATKHQDEITKHVNFFPILHLNDNSYQAINWLRKNTNFHEITYLKRSLLYKGKTFLVEVDKDDFGKIHYLKSFWDRRSIKTINESNKIETLNVKNTYCIYTRNVINDINLMSRTLTVPTSFEQDENSNLDFTFLQLPAYIETFNELFPEFFKMNLNYIKNSTDGLYKGVLHSRIKSNISVLLASMQIYQLLVNGVSDFEQETDKIILGIVSNYINQKIHSKP